MATVSAQSADVRRREAIVMLDSGAPPTVVARSIGITTRTLRRWMAGRTPAVSPTLAAATAAAEAVHVATLDDVSATLEDIAAELRASVRTIVAIRDDPNEDAHARLKAAMTLLDRGGVVAGTKIDVRVAAMTPSELSAQILAMPAPEIVEVVGNREAVAK